MAYENDMKLNISVFFFNLAIIVFLKVLLKPHVVVVGVGLWKVAESSGCEWFIV